MKSLINLKKCLKTLITASITLALSTSIATAAIDKDHAKIERVLASYGKALNNANADKIITLYTKDGVFMPQHSMPSVGRVKIRTAYDHVFKAIKLDVKFAVDEIQKLSPNWAFVRTRSTGFVTINATGNKGAEGNQELFVLNKQTNGEWKIARYIFSTTNPRRN